MPGAVSGLSVAWGGQKRTQSILVATSPDPEVVGSSDRPLLTLLNSKGRMVWQKVMKAPVKEQDIASDGSFIVITNYSHEILAWNSKGNRLWSIQGLCRPQIFRFSNKILCYHDDDADPKVAFDLLDRNGNKLTSYPITGDVLGLKVSQDEKSLAVGLSGGQLLYFNLDGEPPTAPVWSKSLGGEIVDVAVSSGPQPRVAAIVRFLRGEKSSLYGHRIVIFDQAGNPKGVISQDLRPHQIEFSSDTENIYYYGNNQFGQQLGAWAQIGTDWKEIWRQYGPSSAEYSSILTVVPSATEERLWLGFEADVESEIDTGLRRSHLLSFDRQGGVTLDLPPSSDEVAHLYTYRIVPGNETQRGHIVTATDDARVSLYRLEER